ncbi:MAG: hypothetical protein Q9184_004358 [Pyrenodesmia sp. 2 TL-2023]
MSSNGPIPSIEHQGSAADQAMKISPIATVNDKSREVLAEQPSRTKSMTEEVVGSMSQIAEDGVQMIRKLGLPIRQQIKLVVKAYIDYQQRNGKSPEEAKMSSITLRNQLVSHDAPWLLESSKRPPWVDNPWVDRRKYIAWGDQCQDQVEIYATMFLKGGLDELKELYQASPRKVVDAITSSFKTFHHERRKQDWIDERSKELEEELSFYLEWIEKLPSGKLEVEQPDSATQPRTKRPQRSGSSSDFGSLSEFGVPSVTAPHHQRDTGAHQPTHTTADYPNPKRMKISSVPSATEPTLASRALGTPADMPSSFSPSTEPTYPTLDFLPRTSNAHLSAETPHDHRRTASSVTGSTMGRSTTPPAAEPEPDMPEPIPQSPETDEQLLTRALVAMKDYIDETLEADPVAHAAVIKAYNDINQWS